MSSAFQAYYENQVGGGRGGMEVYRGTRYQRGVGIGGVIKGLLKLGLPIFKKAATSLGKHVLSTGVDVGGRFAGDVLKGKSIRQSLKQRSLEGGKQIMHKTLRIPKQRSSKKKTITRKKPRDIFV